MDIFWNYTKSFYFMYSLYCFKLGGYTKQCYQGCFRVAAAKKDSPVTSPQIFKVSPLAFHFDHL